MDDAVGEEVTPGNAIDSTPLRNKEIGHSLMASSSKVLDAHEMVTPCQGDHHESSNHMYSEILDGKSLDRIRSSEHASASPRCMDDAVVEELTLRNYNGENIPIVGTSSNRDRVQTRQNRWQNLYQIAGGSFNGSIASEAGQRDKGWAKSTVWENMDYTFLPGFLDQNKNSSNDNEVNDPTLINDGISATNNASLPSGGIRTKILSKSGFSEYFIKSTLKGKGVICKGPVHRRPAGESGTQIYTKPTNVSIGNSSAPITSAAETVPPPSCDISESLPGLHSNASNDGINLREWLKSGHNKVNKFESLRIFRRIVQVVDFAHNQGVAFRELQPSCFKLLQSNQVIYIGSSVRTNFRDNITNQDVPQLDMNKKRPLELNALSLVSSMKRPKYGEEMSLARRWPQFPPRSGFKSASNDTRAGIPASQDSRNDNGEEQFAKSECKASIKFGTPHVSNMPQPLLTSASCMLEEKWYTSPEQFSERVCSSSSNIYCLGVLLFELLGSFNPGRLHAAAMLDLRHRILPPGFLSEHPREAGFCLWLLHPDPSLRPTTRDILQSEVISGIEEVTEEKLLSSIDEDDAESELLMHFLLSLKEKKEKDASKLVADIGSIEADILEVERRQPRNLLINLSSYQESVATKMFAQTGSKSSDVYPMLQHVGDTDPKLTRNMKQLESAYFSTRSNIQLPGNSVVLRRDTDLLKSRESDYMTRKDEEKLKPSDRLGCFFDGLCKYARYSKFKVKGILRNAEFNNSANVICSLSFDRDEDYLATGGVSKKIKIFEFQALFDDSVDIHYPVVEMPNKSKLSCICWNSYIRNYLASTDYDGLVKLWDASTGQTFTQFAEHDERAWSVDFSRVDPTRLASGSDDRLVKLWSLNERNSLCTIKNNANVCCVQFSAESAHLLAFSSADYKTYCYDLRNVSSPWCILAGHQKAVSYAKFLDAETIVTASTDNTLKIWDLNKTSSTGLSNNACISTLRGHTNEKNFVGLSVADGYIACGSETNEVYTYHKSLPMPMTTHKFGSIDSISGKETDDDNGQFVSSVCWRQKSEMVVAANSTGCVKLLEMV